MCVSAVCAASSHSWRETPERTLRSCGCVEMIAERERRQSRCSEAARSVRCSFQGCQRGGILGDVINVGISSKLLEKQVTL